MVRAHDGDFHDDEPTNNTRRYNVEVRQHTIVITESDLYVSAIIRNLNTGAELTIHLNRSDFDTRDEMIGELFSGSLPNIRDCYDSDAWVTTSTGEKTRCFNCGRENSYVMGSGCVRCNWRDDEEQAHRQKPTSRTSDR